ncbi:tumor necrosis factor receptor superfamily member 21 [Spea bombifrons]|uniref:tumor necrosis factor receptor superfamily member 21 n=1 Tax=Spea bombifrons TaxID=233779 RepID=UPI002349B017|nr:tumor necrosis factor receptor superfamily member 21 [Spea bombifrons]
MRGPGLSDISCPLAMWATWKRGAGCRRIPAVSKMSAACLLAIVLFHLNTTGAESVQLNEKTTVILPSVKYHHVDPESNKDLICDKCPGGTYVSKHCTASALRECSPCADGSFTRHENGIERCHVCRPPCQQPMVEKMPCTALSDRECSCPPGAFLSNDTCVPHTLCPIGWGVRKKGSETEDVKCKTCPAGTYSDVPSSVMRCKTHTNCSELGAVVLSPGTNKRDNICGPPSSSSPGANATRAEYEPSDVYNEPEKNDTKYLNITSDLDGGSQRNLVTKSPKRTDGVQQRQPGIMRNAVEGLKNSGFKTTKRGPPRPSAQDFDINEHLPWMIVLFLLLVLVIIVVCSVRKSSRTLKKGPKQDPSSIVEKSGFKKSTALAQNRDKWIYYCNGHGIDILKLVAAQVGSQWQDIYQFLCNANDHEVAAFSNGYAADHERAYAALQHWTVRGPEATLAKLISALRQHRRNDVVEKIRGLMEDTVQIENEKLTLPVNVIQPIPAQDPKSPETTTLTVEPSPMDKSKSFFADESEPLLRCDSTSSGSSALSRTGSFITKEKKDTVLRQVRLDPCDLQPIFDDMLHILSPEELHVIEKIPQAEDKLDRLFEIAGVKSQEASQKLIDSVYSHLPDLL